MTEEVAEKYLERIADLEQQLTEARQIIEAVKAGEVDAFAFSHGDRPEVLTLQSGDYAYRVLVENFNAGALNLTEDGLIVYTNAYFHELLSLPYENVIGNSISDFIHRDSKSAFQQLFKKGLAGQSTGEINLRAGKKTIPVHVALTSLYPQLHTVSMIVTDLSEKKEHEKTLAIKNELQNIFQQAPVGICICSGPDHVFTLANSFFQHVTGITQERLIDKPVRQVLPELQGQGIIELLDAVYNTGKPFNGKEFPARINRNGMPYTVFFDFTFQPLYNDKNQIYGIIAIGVEVTESVTARKKIEESQQRYKTLSEQLEQKVNERTREITLQKEFVEHIINTSHELIGVWNKDFRLLMINEASVKALGMNKEEILGKTLYEIFPGVKGSKSETNLIQALNGEVVYNEAYHSPLTGRWVQNYITPLRDENGNIYAALGIATDVTEILKTQEELKQSEEKFNKLFSASPLSLTLSDIPSGKIIDANEAFLETVEYTKDECIGKTSLELHLIPESGRQQILDQLLQHGYVKNVEVEIRTKSGKIIPILNSSETIQIGEKKYFLSAIIDIADRKKAEQDIQHANTELRKMNEELASFAYVSSHDLQEPLRKIQAFSDRILNDQGKDFSDKTKEHFNRIINASAKMQNLIDALLNYSRANTSEKRFIETDLNEILEEVKLGLQDVIEEKKAEIISKGLPVLAVIPHQFNQLLSNIISNSLKYSKADVAPVIKIQAEKISGHEIAPLPEANIKYWKISIADNGIGFEQKYENKIFELFQRLHGKSEYSGTGIGLAICKKIVQNHKGIITASSEPGGGATFNIYLPDINRKN